MARHSVVGKSIFRLDALDKVTGRAKYCEDLKMPGMLYGKVLRSPYPHAHITSIDTSRAENMSGVRAVITGRDVPEKRYGPSVFDQHVLARGIVRYIGDPVAAVAADSIEIAERALDLITVEYKELSAIFDIEEAWKKNPSVIGIFPSMNWGNFRLRVWFPIDQTFATSVCSVTGMWRGASRKPISSWRISSPLRGYSTVPLSPTYQSPRPSPTEV
jgi:CO/xanthine dehydrogenase Mo-binding subunit